MSTKSAPASTSGVSEFPVQQWESGTARLTAHRGRSGGVVTVHGEIDAANSEEFAEHLEGCAASCEWLIVDLSDLEFIGTAGFAVLQRIGRRWAKARIYWRLVPGDAASRLLRVCDPNRNLPVAESVAAALTSLSDPRRLLHLVP